MECGVTDVGEYRNRLANEQRHPLGLRTPQHLLGMVTNISSAIQDMYYASQHLISVRVQCCSVCTAANGAVHRRIAPSDLEGTSLCARPPHCSK
jgi:hypothetical protein